MPFADAPDEARRAHVAKSNRQWRAIFGGLAIVAPLLLGGLLHRQTRRLEALVAHGERATATVTRVDGVNGITHYRYEAEGSPRDWNVRSSEAPASGDFDITYSPGDPGLSRPVWPYTRAHFVAERHPGILWGAPLGIFGFFFGASVLCHVGVRKNERGEDRGPPRKVDADKMGTIIAALILLALLAGTLASDSQEVFRTLWGPRPLGVPLFAFTGVVAVVLYLPWFLATPALCRLVLARPVHERDFDEVGILRALWHANEAQRPDRRKVVFTCAYSVLLIALWIAYAAFRGV